MADNDQASGSAVAAAEAAAAKSSRGLWIRGAIDNDKLQEMEDEGVLTLKQWRSASGHSSPTPADDERVLFTTHVDHGLSLPPSEFLLEVLNYGVQLHNLPPNSILEISSFVALSEGYLGVKPSLDLFRYYYGTRKNTITPGVPYNTGTLSLVIRRGRLYPRVNASDSVKSWAGTFFYHKNETIPDSGRGLLSFVDGPAPPRDSWDASPPELSADMLLAKRRIEFLVRKKGLTGVDLVHCWLDRRIQPLQLRIRLMCEVTSNLDDSLRVSPHRLPAAIYKTRIQFLVSTRVNRQVPSISLPMFTAEKPVTPLKDLPETELGPVEGYPPEEPVTVDEDDEPLAERGKKRKNTSTVIAAGSQTLPIAKKAKALGSKKKPESKSRKNLVQKKLTISPAAPPPTPNPSSSAPEITPTPSANLRTGFASTADPEDDQVFADTQTSERSNTQPESESAIGGSDTNLGEPKGKDPVIPPEEQLITVPKSPKKYKIPGCDGEGLTRKKMDHIEFLARECLKTKGLSRAEQEQEVRDINFENLLEKVEARDAQVKAGKISASQVEPITLPEKVYHTINAGYLQVAGKHMNLTLHNQELLRNIRDKRKEIKALQLANATLQVQKDELEELLSLSQNLTENAQDYKVLQSENAFLREELQKLKDSHEKSVANILESSNHATEKLERVVAVQDKKIVDLGKEVREQADLVSELRDQIRILKEEQTVIDRNVLGPLDLGVAASEPRLTKLEILGNLTPDLLQVLTEAAATVEIDIADQESALEVRNKVKVLPKLIEDWKISYARTASQNALTMVLSHHNTIQMYQVTRGICTTDDEGNPQDIKAIHDSVAGYACRVAEMTNYSEPFFASVACPPTPPTDSEANFSEKAAEEDHTSASPARRSTSPAPAA